MTTKEDRYKNWQRRLSAEKKTRTELLQKVVASQAPCPRSAVRGVNRLRSLFGLDPITEKEETPPGP